jgi:hypothetical protein
MDKNYCSNISQFQRINEMQLQVAELKTVGILIFKVINCKQFSLYLIQSPKLWKGEIN